MEPAMDDETPNGLTAAHFLPEVQLLRDRVSPFEEYPFCLPAVKALDTLTLHPKVTFLIGENGSGKSTLLEAVAVGLGLNAEGGSRNFNFTTRSSHSSLCDFLRLRRSIRRPRDCWFLRAESFFNVATEIENLDAASPITPANPAIADAYGERSLHEQSHGESFFSLFQHRFHGTGLYLLDEPEAALSPMRQMSFLSILHDLVSTGSQFIIATHSPIIMAYPDAWIYVLGGSEIVRVPYKQTEHYKVTRDFLVRSDQMVDVLIGKEPTLFDGLRHQKE
ncbi:MAG TPA: AAA family ATPase [Tepidisphaeraceae bacterium]|nr:AAA family ATPase [Tepidisphaeraceae bacterium]